MTTEFCWLIESVGGGSTPVYFGGDGSDCYYWTCAPTAAVRFLRKEDAARVIRILHIEPSVAVAREHGFPQDGELQSRASGTPSDAMAGRDAGPEGNPSSSALAEDGPKRKPESADTEGWPRGDEASLPLPPEPLCRFDYGGGRGICNCKEADLLHAIPGTPAYEEMDNRRRGLLAEIGGAHPWTSPPSLGQHDNIHIAELEHEIIELNKDLAFVNQKLSAEVKNRIKAEQNLAIATEAEADRLFALRYSGLEQKEEPRD